VNRRQWGRWRTGKSTTRPKKCRIAQSSFSPTRSFALEGRATIDFISQHVGDTAMYIGFVLCVGILAAWGEANLRV
jgi:hypothetical protein